MRSIGFPVLATVLGAALALSPVAQPYVNFEGSQTDPIVVSADGTRLFALNTPDNRLAVYSLTDASYPVLLREIPVGVEPVSIRQRTDDEVWVVNQISDSISVVSLSRGTVVATIAVKDEPGDVVFAGDPQRAFVSVQTDREVRVLDVTTYQQLAAIPIFGDDPKALEASADGQTVWVAVFRSGARTTLVPAHLAPPPPPPTNPNLPPAPQQGLIVLADDPTWQSTHNVVLPDNDVVEIDVAGMSVRRNYSGVGTILFNVVERPNHPGELWVPQLHALNLIRFEPNLRGHAIDNEIARIRTGAQRDITVADLNPGIDYTVLPNKFGLESALAYPTDIVFSPSGDEMYLAAFGTDRVGVVDPQTFNVLERIEVGPATGRRADPRTKRGPRGLAHHPTAARLYVLNRLSNSITIIDTSRREVVRELPMVFDPTPGWLRESRGFLYDAKLSGSGTFACAGCHIDGTTDNVGWDLGDPGGNMQSGVGPNGQRFPLHPMKGPMTTQTLQGLAGTTPLHWRGDKPTFDDFNGAFDALMGKTRLSTTDMAAYTRFANSIIYPPNPRLNLDRTFSTNPPGLSAEEGRQFFLNTQFTPGAKCVDCHALPFGTDRNISDPNVLMRSQPMKVAQLRNVYKRTGKKQTGQGRTLGFGNAHDGEFDSVFDLLSDPVFRGLSTNTANKTKLMNFIESFDTGTAPVVGYTLTTGSGLTPGVDVATTYGILKDQARRRFSDFVVRIREGGRDHGYVYNFIIDTFLSDETGRPPIPFGQMQNRAVAGQDLMTAMGVPFGSGGRIGVDRDVDGRLDGDERPQPYGSASPSCASQLTIETNSPTDLGNDQFALVTRGAGTSATGWTIVGFAPTSFSLLGVELLVDLTDATVLPFAFDRHGVGAATIPIPDDPALANQSAFFQTIVTEPCAPFGFAATHGLEVVLGV